jgi:hypothetical protein
VLPQTATTETLSGVANTDGWCVATNGTTNVNVTTSAPARVTTAISRAIRFVSVRFIAAAVTPASTRICHAIGSSLPATSCDALDADTVGVLTDGQSATYAIARDLGPTRLGLPTINVQADAGTDGRVCVVVGW